MLKRGIEKQGPQNRRVDFGMADVAGIESVRGQDAFTDVPPPSPADQVVILCCLPFAALIAQF